jgi:hypothetical protein
MSYFDENYEFVTIKRNALTIVNAYTSSFIKLIYLIAILTLFSSCLMAKGKIQVTSSSKITSPLNFSVANVQVINHQFVITGTGLNNVTEFKIKDGASITDLEIESQSNTSIIANTLANISFASGTIFDFILSNASAASTFQVTFSNANNSITALMLTSMGATKGQVMKYNGSSWVASSITNAQTYLGTWDAATNNPDLTTPSSMPGDYYIVSVAGTFNSVSYAIGDWIISDGYNWQKVANSAVVVSTFNGRRGIVTLVPGDYVSLKNGSGKLVGSSLNDLADLNIVTPLNGSVLKYDTATSKWIVGVDNSGGGAYTGAFSKAVATDGAGALTTSTTTAAELNYVSGVTSSIQTQLGAKLGTALANGNIFVGNGSGVATAVALSGDATLINSGAITLKNTGTAGTYTSVTTDAQGRVTAGTNPAVAAITALTGDVTASGTGSVAATIATSAVTTGKILDGTVLPVDLDFTGTNIGTSGLVIRNLTGGFTPLVCSTVGHVPTWTVAGFTCQATSTGTVTAVSVASSNGFTGSSSGGATPALTLTTSVTGILKGNGTAMSAAVAGTDYLAPAGNGSALTGITASQIGGTLPLANGGTGAVTAPLARASLGAAASGANSDITSLTGLTTALSVAQGGTGLTSGTLGGIPYYIGTGTLASSSQLLLNGIVLGGGTTAPATIGLGTANQVLTSSGVGGPPTWQTPASGATFPLLATPVGTATAPAYSFTGDTGTGMYSDAAGHVKFTAVGKPVLDLQTATSAVNYFVMTPSATAVAPILTSGGSDTTGSGLGLNIKSRFSNTNAGGPITIETGYGSGFSGVGGQISLIGGSGSGSIVGVGGGISLTAGGASGGSSSLGGSVTITAGDADATTGTGGSINLVTGTAATKGNITLMTGAVGIGTTTPTSMVALGPEADRVFQIERRTTTAAGNKLTVLAGGARSAQTNLAGGELQLSSGISTGTAGSFVSIYTATGGATGTADRTPTEKMRIESTGNVGIGTQAPSYRLHVLGTGGATVGYFSDGTATCSITPATAGNISCSSDVRLKKNIESFPDLKSLDNILKLKTVTYEWKDIDNGRHTGFIAQEVEKIAPEFVINGKDGFKQVSYSGFIPWITGAIKAFYGEFKVIVARVLSLEEKDAAKERAIASINVDVAKLESDNKTMKATYEAEKATFVKKFDALKKENELMKAKLDRIEKMLGASH